MAVIVDVDGAMTVHGNGTPIALGAWCAMAPPLDGIDHGHGIVHVQVHGHDHGADHALFDGHAASKLVTGKPGNHVRADVTTRHRDVIVEARRW